MKNKNITLLLGIGIAYLLYKMYAKKGITNIIKNPVMPPLVNYPSPYTDVIDVSSVPSQFLVDKVKTAEVSYQPDTYQTYYGIMSGHKCKVPSTC